MTSDPEQAPRDEAKWSLHDDRAQIRQVESAFVDHLQKHGYPEAAVFACRLAMEEAVVNAFRHGHAELPGEPIAISWRVGPEQMELTIEDKGPGFDPQEIPDPTLEENIETPSGRGIMLIKAYMSEVSFNDAGNRLSMIFRKPETD